MEKILDNNLEVYGVRKLSKQLSREGHQVPRCPIEWLMRELGLRDAVRGRGKRTTVPRADRRRPPGGSGAAADPGAGADQL